MTPAGLSRNTVPGTAVFRLIEGAQSVRNQERPYHVDRTTSRPLCEVKRRRARLVLRWGTTWEALVLFLFFLAPRINQIYIIPTCAQVNLLRPTCCTEQQYLHQIATLLGTTWGHVGSPGAAPFILVARINHIYTCMCTVNRLFTCRVYIKPPHSSAPRGPTWGALVVLVLFSWRQQSLLLL